MSPTIAFGGDVMLGRGVAEAIGGRAVADVWAPDLRAVFAEADAVVVNLECCISERGEPWDPHRKPFHFRAPPRAVEALTAIGVRAVWLANNHALDFGPTALEDTLGHLAAAGIAVVGAGHDLEEARAGRVIDAGGARIGLIGFADHPPDFAARSDAPGIAFAHIDDGAPPWIVEALGTLSRTCDVVVAGPHWGPNMTSSPPDQHRRVAADLVGAGLGALTGHSAHVVHGVERLHGVPICYDLGDLLDDYAIDPVLRNDLGIVVLWRPTIELLLVPIRLDYARTGLARGADLAWIVERMRGASAVFGTSCETVEDRLRIDLRA
jgi:poly-gamma-glutamate capsule biosynthesis protein CapA/YwtB (metallophosphatase superfamily)